MHASLRECFSFVWDEVEVRLEVPRVDGRVSRSNERSGDERYFESTCMREGRGSVIEGHASGQ